jgi:protein-tyrosine-phosphatase
MSKPIRVLILCTRNSARSQMAHAILARDGGARVVVASAGSDPGSGVHPLAVEALAGIDIDWRNRPAQGMAAVEKQTWDLVITVCDAARDACPIPPAGAISAHWGIPDPAAATGSHADQLRAFIAGREQLQERIDAFLALPIEELRATASTPVAMIRRDALIDQIRAIGELP